MTERCEATVDGERLRFLGHVLEAYFAWRRDTDMLGFVACARVMGIPEPIENRRVLNLSDDQFLRVDNAYAQCRDEILPPNCHPPGSRLTCGEIISIEYGSGGSTQQKARRLGFEGPNYSAIVGRYRRGVAYGETMIYWAAMPELEQWQGEIL